MGTLRGVARGAVRRERKRLVQGLMDHDDGIWVYSKSHEKPPEDFIFLKDDLIYIFLNIIQGCSGESRS